MSIFDGKATRRLRAEVRELQANTEQLRGQVRQYQQVQETLVKDILTLTETERSFVGNEYKDYATAVQAISDKYECKSDWGVIQTRNIISLRAAFVLGEGIRVTHTTQTRAEAERELQFVDDFRGFNDLDGELDQEMAKEAEIEGKIAIRLYDTGEAYREWPGMISARYVSWLAKKYTVTADPNDYLWYRKIEWNATGTTPAGSLPEPNFVYAKFGGRTNKPNDAQPAIMACLTQIDRLDKALRDLREINNFFASPTPHFKCSTQPEVNAMQAYIEQTNWKIGKALSTMAEFSFISPDTAGVENLIKEIELNVKLVSGATGIPIHFLGLLDLLKNRATGENTRELIMATTTRERQTWIAVYEEMFTKAMMLWNSIYAAQKSEKAKLDPTRIRVEIPQITQEYWDRIQNVLIPAAANGIISKEYVAGQIPGIDMGKEAELRAARDVQDAERAAAEARLLADRMSGAVEGEEETEE